MIRKGLVISGFLVCLVLSLVSVSALNEGSEFVPDISEGKTRTFYPGDVLGFNILGGRHTFLLANIKNDVVNVKLSEPVMIASMVAGEEKRFDFNGDDIYDVYVRINSVQPSGLIYSANITVQAIAESTDSIQEPVEPEVVEEPEENISETSDEVVIEEGSDEIKDGPESDDGWKIALWIAGGLIICAAVVYLFFRKK